MYTLTEAETLTAKERYRMELAQLPELSVHEQDALVDLARAGDRTARARLVESCLAHVQHVAVRYARLSGIDVLDLVQAGNLRMMERLDAALEAANPVGFLITAARGAISNYSKEFQALIRVPHASWSRGVRVRVVSLDAPLYDDSDVTLADVV